MRKSSPIHESNYKLFVVIAGMGIVYMVLSIFGGFSALEQSLCSKEKVKALYIF